VRNLSERIASLLALQLLIAFSLVLPGIASASVPCAPPHYRVGRDFLDSKLGTGSLFISIRPNEFSLTGVICLVRALRESHPNWKSVAILVFNSHDAAMYFQLSAVEDLPGRSMWVKQLHVAYFLDADKHEEYLKIMPRGFEGESSYDTRIDWPLQSKLRCRFELNERCLLALDGIDYPDEARRATISGAITLTGTITRAGEMSAIRVIEASTEPAERKDVLVNEAVRNLKTWHLEAARHKDSIRITYSYVIESSLSDHRQVEVKLALPNHVTIRGSAPE
jgi:hypothetical protein